MGHEPLSPHTAPVEGSSDRTFGALFTAVFAAVALWPWVFGGGAMRHWAWVISGAFALATVLRPALLAPLNRAWMQLGLLLGRIVSPVVLALLFFAVFTPMGWLMRALGKDPLRLRRDDAAHSYWIERKPPGPAPDSIHHQF